MFLMYDPSYLILPNFSMWAPQSMRYITLALLDYIREVVRIWLIDLKFRYTISNIRKICYVGGLPQLICNQELLQSTNLKRWP